MLHADTYLHRTEKLNNLPSLDSQQRYNLVNSDLVSGLVAVVTARAQLVMGCLSGVCGLDVVDFFSLRDRVEGMKHKGQVKVAKLARRQRHLWYTPQGLGRCSFSHL